MTQTFTQIREWAEARNLIADSIGDCVVVLTILAAQNGLQIEDCIAQAYDEIKERRGVMKDGVFVKDEEATTNPAA